MLFRLLILGAILASSGILAKYEPTWDSLDTRPLPSWYDESKIGILVHWGVYAVPGLGEWFWHDWKGGNPTFVDFMKKFYPPDFTYEDFARELHAEFYNPAEWAEIFSASGARYVGLVAKHCDGYTLWPSKYAYNWNAMDVGPNRDLMGELVDEVRAKKMKFGVHYHPWEWFNPLYLEDKSNGFKTNEYVRKTMIPEMVEMINKYKPEILWGSDAPDADTYYNSTYFLAWLYNESPVRDIVVTNDVWGKGAEGTHGGFFTHCTNTGDGTLQNHKWEKYTNLDKKTSGYRKTSSLSDYLTIEELLKTLASTISCGGNILVNIGATEYGKIPPIGEERLRQMGKWLKVNGEAIYSSRPWVYQNDALNSDVWYTMKGDAPDCTVYAIVLKWPQKNILKIRSPDISSRTVVEMIGYSDELKWTITGNQGDLEIQFPNAAEVPDWAWILRIKDLMNGCTIPSK